MGFTTLATFYGHPSSQRIRVSQVLVLPPYQRQGIGSLLLQAAFKVADDSRAIEVTVSAAFVVLPDLLRILYACTTRAFLWIRSAFKAADDGSACWKSQ